MEPLEAGDPVRIGPYAILGVLGSGGMGKVYLGRSTGGRTVAVKAVRPELADDAGFRVRFRNEVESAKSVSGAFTAAVVDADTEAPVPWFATAYIAGVSLAAAVTRHGPLPEPALRTLTAGLAEAISAVHRAGIVHRDLKPANVLLALDGPYVIDFGITRATDGTALTSAGMVMGSPGFMSPEQASGTKVGPESDMFSLGATLVFAASGRSPFGDGPTPALLYRVVSTEPDISGVPDSLRDMIGAALHKDPHRRPTTQQIIDFLAANAPAPTAGGWLPHAYTADIVAASQVMTGGVGHPPAAGQQGQQGHQVPGQWSSPPTRPDMAPQGGWQNTPPMGNGMGGGNGGTGGPGGKMSRRTLIGLIGGGVAVLGGGTAAAVALTGDKHNPTPGPNTTLAGPTTGASSGASSAPSSADSSASSSAPDTAASSSGGAPIVEPNGTVPQTDLTGSLPQAQALWTQQMTDETWGGSLVDKILVLVGTEKTHALDPAGKTKWADVVCGSGTVGIQTAVKGTTVYATGLDGVGNDSMFAIDAGSGKATVLLQNGPTRDWQFHGVGGIIGDTLFATAALNVLGDGILAYNLKTQKTLWTQNTASIGSLHVPPSGKFIYTGAKTPGDDNKNRITALNVSDGKEAWHFDQDLSVFGDSGGDYFADAAGFVIMGGKLLTAVDPANGGKVVWQARVGNFDLGGSIAEVPVADASGRVYVTADEYVVCVNAKDGKILWQAKAPNQFSIDVPPVIADGNVYVPDYKGVLYAMDAVSGQPKWAYSNAMISGIGGTTTGLFAGGGKVYYTYGRAVICINAAGK